MSGNTELLSIVRAARRRLAEVGPTRSRSKGDFERVALPDRDADVLRDLLVGERARVVIEIGLAYQDRFLNVGWEFVEFAGLAGLARLVIDRSQLALTLLIGQEFVADAAFVDGSHIFRNVFVDLCFLREIIRPAGLIVLDDCDWASVATAVRYFELNTHWTPHPIGRPTRLRAFRLPSPRFEPAFEEFKPFTV